jgi:hypothetical protein
VKSFARDDAKNAKLREERGLVFEDVVFHIKLGDLLDTGTPVPGPLYMAAPFVVRREDYVHLGPVVEDEHTVLRPVLMKTIIPSQKATKEYLGEENGDEA